MQWCVRVRPKSKLQVTRGIIGIGQVNSGGLSVKHAAALAWQRAFCKQSSLFDGLFYLFCFLNVGLSFFFLKIVHDYVDKTESLLTCRISSKLLFFRQFCRQSTCQRRALVTAKGNDLMKHGHISYHNNTWNMGWVSEEHYFNPMFRSRTVLCASTLYIIYTLLALNLHIHVTHNKSPGGLDVSYLWCT